jgi:hypothetical protein
MRCNKTYTQYVITRTPILSKDSNPCPTLDIALLNVIIRHNLQATSTAIRCHAFAAIVFSCPCDLFDISSEYVLISGINSCLKSLRYQEHGCAHCHYQQVHRWEQCCPPVAGPSRAPPAGSSQHFHAQPLRITPNRHNHKWTSRPDASSRTLGEGRLSSA